jgi:hypothetical protein
VLHSPPRDMPEISGVLARVDHPCHVQRRGLPARRDDSMRTIVNREYVKKKKRTARIAALLGFVLLGSTFFLAFNPQYMLMAYAILFTGFIVFNFGMQQLGKWSRNPRNDEALDRLLGGLTESKFTMIHYTKVGKRVIEHLLVHPGGVSALTVRELPGTVTYDGKRWRKRGAGITRFFSMSGPQLGNPTFDMDADVAALEVYLAEKNIGVDIYPAIVFINDRVDLDVADEIETPVMRGDVLDGFIRQIDADTEFRPADRDALVAALTADPGFDKTESRPTKRPVKVKARPNKKKGKEA